MNEEELLYDKIYERTIEFGRTHFIKEIMKLTRENTELKGLLKQATHNEKQASDSCRQHKLASKNHIRRLKRREEQIDRYKQENQSLKDRIEKAIAYIKELDDETDDTIYDIDRSVKNELLLLLKFDERKANELIAKADDLLKGDK